MPKTVQIRDLDDDIYAGLARRAAADGVTVTELIRAEVARLADRPTGFVRPADNRIASLSHADILAATSYPATSDASSARPGARAVSAAASAAAMTAHPG